MRTLTIVAIAVAIIAILPAQAKDKTKHKTKDEIEAEIEAANEEKEFAEYIKPLVLVSPQKGEKIEEDQVVKITWIAPTNVSKVRIILERELGNARYIASETTNSGSYEWTVSFKTFERKKSTFRIFVDGVDTVKRPHSGKTEHFTISPIVKPSPAVIPLAGTT